MENYVILLSWILLTELSNGVHGSFPNVHIIEKVSLCSLPAQTQREGRGREIYQEPVAGTEMTPGGRSREV